MKTFRLIESGFADAATNMAIDEAIFLCYRENRSSPTLRLYGWNPATFSIGVSQKTEQLSLNSAYVRRPTGGGALFHDNELTYSFVASCQDLGLSSNVKESYATVTSFLIKCYALLGLRADFANNAVAERPIDRHAIAALCQSRQEDYDIVINGAKIGGNAQKRRKNIFLQHGSVPMDPLSLATEKTIGFQELSKIMTVGFSRHFNAELAPGDLTQEELACARELKIEKYGDEEWNRHGKPISAKALVA